MPITILEQAEAEIISEKEVEVLEITIDDQQYSSNKS